MKFLRILLVTVALFGRFCSCSQSNALCKTSQIGQEQRNKGAFAGTSTQEKLQCLRALPDCVKVIIEKFAVEPWKNYSGSCVGREISLGLLFDEREQLLSYATGQAGIVLTTFPTRQDPTWSHLVVYQAGALKLDIVMPMSSLVSAAAFDPSGEYYIAGEVSGKVSCFALLGPREEMEISDTEITSIAVSCDSTYLLIADGNNKIYCFLLKSFLFKNFSKNCLLTIRFAGKLCPGAALAYDGDGNLVCIKDCSEKMGRGVIKVIWRKQDQDTKKFIIRNRFVITEPGEVRSVALNHAATRLAVVSDNQSEMRKNRFSFYYSNVTLWDLVHQKFLIGWMQKMSINDRPASGIMLRGNDSVVVNGLPGKMVILHAPKAKGYQERMARYREKHDLTITVPRFVNRPVILTGNSSSSATVTSSPSS